MKRATINCDGLYKDMQLMLNASRCNQFLAQVDLIFLMIDRMSIESNIHIATGIIAIILNTLLFRFVKLGNNSSNQRSSGWYQLSSASIVVNYSKKKPAENSTGFLLDLNTIYFFALSAAGLAAAAGAAAAPAAGASSTTPRACFTETTTAFCGVKI